MDTLVEHGIRHVFMVSCGGAMHLDDAAGRPGPVWIDIPLDVQGATVDVDELEGFDPAELGPSVTMTETEIARVADDVIDDLQRAERPLILVGAGVRLGHAEEGVRSLV